MLRAVIYLLKGSKKLLAFLQNVHPTKLTSYKILSSVKEASMLADTWDILRELVIGNQADDSHLFEKFSTQFLILSRF